MIALVAPAIAQSGRAANPPTEGKKTPASADAPMVFYLAKGEPDACGPGCSEWIAAEGRIDVGAAQRLRALLNRLGKRNLPIFFHSPGGIGTTAMEIGRLLRGREMMASVYQTIPADCAGAGEDACRALKQSGQALPSALRSMGGCNSACVFALIGAKVRQVPPGARLGVHSAKVTVRRSDGRKVDYSDREVASFQRTKLAEINVQFRRYVQEMKVDVRLFDLLSKVPHEDVYYLSRDEIVSFGIDTREFLEARWRAMELMPQQLWAMKYFVEAKGEGRKELHTNVIRLECGGPYGVKVSYFRSLAPHETVAGRTIKLAVGDQSAALSASGAGFKVEAIESGTTYGLWSAHAPYEFFEAAAAAETVEIVESGSAGTTPHITRLSAAGLSQAIAALRKRCGDTCPPGDSWVAAVPSANWIAAVPPPSWAAGALLPKPGAPPPNCPGSLMIVR